MQAWTSRLLCPGQVDILVHNDGDYRSHASNNMHASLGSTCFVATDRFFLKVSSPLVSLLIGPHIYSKNVHVMATKF